MGGGFPPTLKILLKYFWFHSTALRSQPQPLSLENPRERCVVLKHAHFESLNFKLGFINQFPNEFWGKKNKSFIVCEVFSVCRCVCFSRNQSVSLFVFLQLQLWGTWFQIWQVSGKQLCKPSLRVQFYSEVDVKFIEDWCSSRCRRCSLHSSIWIGNERTEVSVSCFAPCSFNIWIHPSHLFCSYTLSHLLLVYFGVCLFYTFILKIRHDVWYWKIKWLLKCPQKYN